MNASTRMVRQMIRHENLPGQLVHTLTGQAPLRESLRNSATTVFVLRRGPFAGRLGRRGDDVQIAAVPQQLIARGTWGVAPVPRAAPRRSPVDRERLPSTVGKTSGTKPCADQQARSMTLQVSVPRRASAGKTHRRPTEDAHVEQEDSGRRRRRRHPRACRGDTRVRQRRTRVGHWPLELEHRRLLSRLRRHRTP